MKRINLTRYLIEEQREHNTIPAELRLLLEVVARACKAISHSINKGALAGVLGSAGTGNVQGETQQKLKISERARFGLRSVKAGCAISARTVSNVGLPAAPGCMACSENHLSMTSASSAKRV